MRSPSIALYVQIALVSQSINVVEVTTESEDGTG